MINTQTLVNFPVFGDNATKAQPDNAKYAAGFQPADVYPAEWVNWVWNKASGGVTALNTGVDMMEREINNVLDGADKTPDATKDNQLLEAIQKLISDAKAQAILAAHPVGSLYWSSQSTDPGTLFGGTWQRIKDKFILAAGDTYSNGDTGGAATVTLTTNNLPAHTHSVGAHAHGLNSHTHKVTASGTVSSHKHSVGAHSHGLNSHTHKVTASGTISVTTNPTFSGQKHMWAWRGWAPTQTLSKLVYDTSNVTVTMETISSNLGFDYTSDRGAGIKTEWTDTGTISGGAYKFTGTEVTSGASSGSTANSTAFDSGSTQPTFTGSEVTSGAASGNTANSSAFDSGSTGSGTAVNKMPPYLVKYCWERVS